MFTCSFVVIKYLSNKTILPHICKSWMGHTMWSKVGIFKYLITLSTVLWLLFDLQNSLVLLLGWRFFNTGVTFLVPLQVSHVSEILITLTARKWLFPSVNPMMLEKVSWLWKRFLTMVTNINVGFLSIAMFTSVVLQKFSGGHKFFTTLVAWEGLFTTNITLWK